MANLRRRCVCGSGQASYRCSRCRKGRGVCVTHGRRKYRCILCTDNERLKPGAGAEMCEHLIQKKYCRQCGGSHLCAHCRLVCVRRKFELCYTCSMWMQGNPVYRKELKIKRLLHLAASNGIIPLYDQHNRRLSMELDVDIYGKARPDFLWRMASFVVILEVDEMQHKAYDAACERKRELDLVNSAKGTPVYLIRYNPDSFSTASKRSTTPFVGREQRLLDLLEYVLINTPKQDLFGENIFVKSYLCYDCHCTECEYIHTECFMRDVDLVNS
jgi:hypothetical protein